MLAVIYHSTVIRLIPIGLVLIGLQESIFVDFRPFGVIIQLVLAFSVAAGVAGGSDKGAIAGFVLGIMFDLAVGRPLGSSAISFGVGGVVGGWIFLIRVEKQWWLNAVFVALGSAVGELVTPIVKLMLGDNGFVNSSLWRIVLVVAISGGLLSPLLLPPARWAMRVASGAWQPGKVKSIDSENAA